MSSTINASTASGGGVITSADASGVLALQTGGTTAVTIDASQNVGIGTSSPSSALQISRSGAAGLTTSSTGGGGNWEFGVDGSGNGYIYSGQSKYLAVSTSGIERARIDSSGNLLVGQASGSYNIISKVRNSDNGEIVLSVERQQTGVSALLCYSVSQTNYNAANAANKMGRDTTTQRSLNAGGTVNASGADYAEYMTKSSNFNLAKGDVVGIDANGKLTNVYADAVSFVVKSTNPSYVGGDTWGSGLEDNSEELEAARQLVDRIAFAGQVPVNVLGATAGQYIIPINDKGTIKGEAVSSPTFEQYQIAVGKVIAIEADGCARIIVKVA